MIHLVTGGSGSGKSAYAEQCILDFGGTRRVYIATMQPFGAEGQARIARHRKMRVAKQFSTIDGVESMSSSNTTGSTTITITFSLNRSMDAVTQDVSSAISAAQRYMLVHWSV